MEVVVTLVLLNGEWSLFGVFSSMERALDVLDAAKLQPSAVRHIRTEIGTSLLPLGPTE